MAKEVAAVVAAAAESRGIGYQGQLVSDLFFVHNDCDEVQSMQLSSWIHHSALF